VALNRFELALLADLGFGLDLDECAATGSTQDLVWVSPESGRAVSRAAGQPYRERLLPLPAFLRRSDDAGPPIRWISADGLRLTGFFLSRHVHEPRRSAMPPERQRIVGHGTSRPNGGPCRKAPAWRAADRWNHRSNMRVAMHGGNGGGGRLSRGAPFGRATRWR
jgi:hypothetical protein